MRQLGIVLVLGVKDKELSRTLQMKPDLTLKMAVDLARQQEAVLAQIQQQRQLQSVDAVNRSYSGARSGHRSRPGDHRDGTGGHRGASGGHRGKTGSHHASSRGQHYYGGRRKCSRCGRDQVHQVLKAALVRHRPKCVIVVVKPTTSRWYAAQFKE